MFLKIGGRDIFSLSSNTTMKKDNDMMTVFTFPIALI